jgi:hypothetical protein
LGQTEASPPDEQTLRHSGRHFAFLTAGKTGVERTYPVKGKLGYAAGGVIN